MTSLDNGRLDLRRWWHDRDLAGGLFDSLALVAVLGLVALGTLNIFAVGGWSRAAHQAVVVATGLALLFALRRVRVERLAFLGWACYGLSTLLLVVVLLVGLEAHGARRWLHAGWFTVQPSELAKVGLLLVLAHVLASERPAWRRCLEAIGLALVPIGLTAVQPDLSTATLLAALTAAMLLLARLPFRVLLPVFASAAVAVPLAIPLLHDYQLERLQVFFSGSAPADDAGYTLLQAHIALASGGLTGRFGEPHDALLADYLPANETDLAVASLVQQFGLVAGAAALVAMLVVVWRLALASRAPRTHLGMLVPAGLAALFGIQSIVSLGGNLGALPIAGIPFPLLSYGGTAAVAYLAAVGIVLGVRRDGVRRRLWAAPVWMRPRPRWVGTTTLAVTGVLVALSAYGWHLHEARGLSLRQAGKTQMTRCIRIPAIRGNITDRHGAPLAVNDTRYDLAGVPRILLRRPEALSRLAVHLARPAAELRRTLAEADGMVLRLAPLPLETGSRIAAEVPGALVLPSPRRVYPHGPLLGPLLGFAGADTPEDHRRWPGLPLGELVGRAGIERQYDPVLRGVPGEQCFFVDPPGRPVAMGSRREPLPGLDLRLSVDLGLQGQLSAALADAQGRSGGDLAGGVVMEARTGQILAMASLPSHDNNLYGPPVDVAALRQARAAPGHPTLEHASQVAAPPGSIFKLVVAAANLVDPVLPPDQVIPTGGSFTHAGHSFGNWRTLGPQNLVQALAWSNDVYFYKLALMLGPERIHDVGTALGAGQPTGIDLPGERPGFLGTPRSVEEKGGTWYPGAAVVLGIGQGQVTSTPLQAARWTAAIATGHLVTPRLGLAFDAGDGSLTALPATSQTPLPFAPALGPVREGMRQAVMGGTARILKDLPVPALAKTGTAQDPASPNGETDAWFVAAAPADDPAVVLTSFVRGGGSGSGTTGPVARHVLQHFFDHRDEILR